MSDFRVTIDVKNVAKGDIKVLCEDIMRDFGEDYDAASGEFRIRTSERVGEGHFSYDWEEDEE